MRLIQAQQRTRAHYCSLGSLIGEAHALLIGEGRQAQPRVLLPCWRAHYYLRPLIGEAQPRGLLPCWRAHYYLRLLIGEAQPRVLLSCWRSHYYLRLLIGEAQPRVLLSCWRSHYYLRLLIGEAQPRVLLPCWRSLMRVFFSQALDRWGSFRHASARRALFDKCIILFGS